MVGLWQADESSEQCTRCKTEFGFFTRRHHCRKCGRLFCGDCSGKTGVVGSYPGAVRVCDSCAENLK
jgi:hypothetical protein